MKITRKGVIHNAYGIHCRPSAVIAKAVKEFRGEITVTGPAGSTANPSSVLSLLGLALTKDDEFTVEVEGDGAEAMADRLKELLESNFDFQR